MAQLVYVLDHDGNPLMPTSNNAKVRCLLKSGKAKVVKGTPFTIQLLYETPGFTQDVVLGVDAGSKTIGLSASTEKKELFAAEVAPRNDVVRKLSDRREFRKSRRNRKTRHRKARFNNRKSSKSKGWIAPSVNVKIQEHVTSIKRVCEILPVSLVIVETAEFDTQLIKAVEAGLDVPVGEDYQSGEQKGFCNVRQYVLYRDGYKCQCCGKHKDIKLHVHHLESRKTGGNSPDNLITLCEECHEKVHLGEVTNDDFKKRKRRSLRDAAFMGIMRKSLISRLEDELDIPVQETKGYITKYVREKNNLDKSHITDALCIARHPTAERCETVLKIKALRHHNRQLHKVQPKKLKGRKNTEGYRQAAQAPTYVHGFKHMDKVYWNGNVCFVGGRRESGSFKLVDVTGKTVKDGVSYKKIRFMEHSSGYVVAIT